MRSRPLSRSSALLLLAVFLATGGLRALDAALYHQRDGAPGAGVARVYGTESPRVHTDQCVLGAELRSTSEVASAPEIPGLRTAVSFAPIPAPVCTPRSGTRTTTPARAPPPRA